MNVKYRIVLATENVLVVNACADAASRVNSAISWIARIPPALIMDFALTELACAKKAGRVRIAPSWTATPCSAYPIAPALRAHSVWSYINAFALADGRATIVPNRPAASIAADMEDARLALASATQDGRANSAKNDSAIRDVTSTVSARMALAFALPAGTESTALWRAALATVPNEANANRLKEVGGAVAAKKAGKGRIAASLWNWNATMAKITTKTVFWTARTLIVAPLATARNLRSASRRPNPSTSCCANSHRP